MQPRSTTIEAGRALAGRYRLDAPLARGGMAQVWRGTDLVLGRPVAIKMLLTHLADDPAFAERFRREAQAAARLNDPRIVSIYDSVDEPDVSAIILEFVDGITLRGRLDEGAMEVHTAVGIAAQVAGALHEAHQLGIVHRDVKPANVLLCRPDTTAEAASPVPRVQVTDFGIAKAIQSNGEVDLTRTGSMLGTAKYLSPEQIQGGPVDPRSDVFSLGVVLYEAMTGRVPWRGDTDLATALARLEQDPLPPRQLRADLPREVEAVVLRALSRDPADRFQTAAELRAALLAVDPGPTPTTMEIPTVREAPTFMQSERGWLLPTLIVLLVVGALVAGGVVLDRTGAGRSLVDAARGQSSSPSTSSTVAGGEPLTGLQAYAYDPRSTGGDEAENDDLTGNAVDGKTSGGDVWRTQCYVQMSKQGVGLIVAAAAVHTLDHMVVFSREGGWRATVYASDVDGAELQDASLSAWGAPIATDVEGAKPETSIPLDGLEARSVLLFITSVDGVAADDCFGMFPDRDAHRVEIDEVQLIGL